jgi:hypothetical protein
MIFNQDIYGFFVVVVQGFIWENMNDRTMLHLFDDLWLDKIIPKINDIYLSIYLWCWLEKGRWPITQVFVKSFNMTKLLVYTVKS